MSHTFLTFDECTSLQSGCLVTINLQHLFTAEKDADFRDAVFARQSSQLCLDGRGARILIQRLTKSTLPLAVGNEIVMEVLLRLTGQRILIIGSSPGSVARLSLKYPNIVVDHECSTIDIKSSAEARKLAKKFLDVYPMEYAAIFIALGVPKQELLGVAVADLIGGTPVYCIGGSFEMIAGNLPRAPRLFQIAGLEGLWRFVIQPSRSRLRRMLESYYSFARLYVRRSVLSRIIYPDAQ